MYLVVCLLCELCVSVNIKCECELNFHTPPQFVLTLLRPIAAVYLSSFSLLMGFVKESATFSLVLMGRNRTMFLVCASRV